MARLLHRLGALAARRPIAVILLWAVLLGAAGAAMTAWQKPMTQEFELPGSDFSRVLDELGEQIPEVAGGTGTVVVHSEDGFDSEERAALEDVRRKWLDLPHVTGVVDPFASQQRIEDAGRRLQRSEQRLEAGQRRLDAGADKLAGLQRLVEQTRAGIAQQEQAAPEDPTLPARRAGLAELEGQLAEGRKRQAAAERRLDRGRAALDAASQLQEAGQGVRTVSEDGSTALVQIRFDQTAQQIDPDVMSKVPDVGQELDGTGVEVDYGQEIVYETEPGGVGEVVGLAAAAVVLLVMLGSLVLSGLPLSVAFVGVGLASMSALALTRWLDLQQMAPVVGTMLGLAVGIDYALFILNRHRHHLHDMEVEGREIDRDQVRASIALAVGTAGTAVVVAGVTVVIALTALTVSGIPVLQQMGLMAAAVVSVTVLVALTLTPALMSLVGRRAVPRSARGAAHRKRGRLSTWPHRWAGLVTRRPVAVVVGGAVLLGLVAVPAASLRLALPDGGSESPDSTAARAYDRVEQAFGAGANGPVLVAADYPEPLARQSVVVEQAAVARAVSGVDSSARVLPVGVSEDRRTLAFQVRPADGPSAQSTVDLVEGLRGLTVDHSSGQVDLGVTGQTVANIEISERLADALPLYLLLVIGLSLLLLTVVFRSLVVPLLATAGFLLSVGAAFGAVVAVYQWGWLAEIFGVHEPGPILSFMPTVLIGILFGLAMDYQMFLVSGMRESYVHGEPARAAVSSGFTSGARVVLAAALIMVSVFAGFVHSPMATARPMAFGLAVGVAIDALVVRMTLTPAAMHLVGSRAWWMPAWLERVLPHLDVEGSSLVEQRRAAGHPVASTDQAREATPVGPRV